MINTVYIGLGTNLGHLKDNLSLACHLLRTKVGMIVEQSSIYQTEAWGNEDQDDYLNQVLCIKTTHPPLEVLKICQLIEQKMGRQRKMQWEPRIIDIDLLFYNDVVVNDSELSLPHPLIAERKFVLIPLNEIAPDLVHPVQQKSIQELLAACPDPLHVSTPN